MKKFLGIVLTVMLFAGIGAAPASADVILFSALNADNQGAEFWNATKFEIVHQPIFADALTAYDMQINRAIPISGPNSGLIEDTAVSGDAYDWVATVTTTGWVQQGGTAAKRTDFNGYGEGQTASLGMRSFMDGALDPTQIELYVDDVLWDNVFIQNIGPLAGLEFAGNAWVVGIDAAADVPVPAAFWLLGSAFVGIIGLRRKTA